ncbi:hypothetical protein C8J57DRAFT_1545035 [Mycena rebaudengoi]|nr:hypothetical protein C8J57DRAFT_1545035 [Mycena rebaudengoi]
MRKRRFANLRQDLLLGTASFRVFLYAQAAKPRPPTENRLPTLMILAPPVLHRDQSATIFRDARFQLDETVDGFQQEVDEVIDTTTAASGAGEGSGGNEGEGGDND